MCPLVCDRTGCCQVLEMFYNIPLKVCVCVYDLFKKFWHYLIFIFYEIKIVLISVQYH
jgi:hypothetical protein